MNMAAIQSPASCWLPASAPGPAPPRTRLLPHPPAPSCEDSAAHRQCDFWVGEQDVTAGGKKVGVNRISKVLAGCLVLQKWTGNAGSGGSAARTTMATPAPDGSVRQLIEESKDDGTSWYVWSGGTDTRRP